MYMIFWGHRLWLKRLCPRESKIHVKTVDIINVTVQNCSIFKLSDSLVSRAMVQYSEGPEV
jgi:hypothetical protein